MTDARTLAERSEEELCSVGLAFADTLRAAELALIVLMGLLVRPPLLVLVVVVLFPAVAFAAVAGVMAPPVFAVRHLHRRSR